MRSDFNRQVTDTANQLASQLNIKVAGDDLHRAVTIEPPLAALRRARRSRRRAHLHARRHRRRAGTRQSAVAGRAAASSAQTVARLPRRSAAPGVVRVAGSDEPIGQVIIQYGRKISDTEATVARVELFLLVGVLLGTGLALSPGSMIARRAMAPIAELTSTAEEIARTRDPSLQRAPAAGRRRGRRARAHAGGNAARARRRAWRDRGDARAPAALRRRRLARAAHAADERARQPRAARRIAARRRGRSRALGAALLAAHAPAGRRPAAARAHRRRARRAARAVRPRADRRRGGRRARAGQPAITRSSLDAQPGASSTARATSCTA